MARTRRIFSFGLLLTTSIIIGIFYFETYGQAKMSYLHQLASRKLYNDSLRTDHLLKDNAMLEKALLAALLQGTFGMDNNHKNNDAGDDMEFIKEPPRDAVLADEGNLRVKIPGLRPAVEDQKQIESPDAPAPTESPFYDVNVTDWTNTSRQVVASFSKYHHIESIHYWGAAQNDRFRPHEEALFAIRRYQSPWLVQFRPPVPLPFNSTICNGSPPFFLIVVPSTPSNRMGRMAIRNTWGSLAQTGVWPNRKLNAKVQILFVVGYEVTYPRFDPVIHEESETYHDILEFSMTEDYRKLTVKMLGTLRWINDNCKGVGFVLKADEDTFVNIPLFVDFLLLYQGGMSRTVLGTMYNAPYVRRWGKWRLSILEYPFERFPSYASGSSYLIAGDALDDLLKASEFFIPIPIEDAFISGVLPKAAGIRRYHTPAMSMMGEAAFSRNFPKMCDFMSTRLTITDCTMDIFDRMWMAVQVDYCRASGRWGLENIAEKWQFKRPSN